MGFSGRIPQAWRYIGIAVFSLLISVYFVYLAVVRHSPSLGGIGGAIGTAVAFASLFVRPDYGLAVYELVHGKTPKDLPHVDRLQMQVDAIVAALRVNSNGQTVQNWSVAIASLIGILFSTFGERLAHLIMDYMHIS